MTPTHIPQKHSQRSFDRMAPALGRALNSVASSAGLIAVKPLDLTPETWREYFRRAIQAKQLYSWHHPMVDNAKFAIHADSLITKTRLDGWVIIGTAEDMKADLPPSTEMVQGAAASAIEIEYTGSPFAPGFTALLQLISAGHLVPVPIILFSEPDAENVRALESTHNIVIEPAGSPGKWKVM